MEHRIDRHRRVAQQIQHHLAMLIQKEVSDPRLGMVGISAVEISKNFKDATIYVSILKDEDIEPSMQALRSAASFLRRELSHSLNQRGTPRLNFKHDTSIKQGADMSQLIDSVL